MIQLKNDRIRLEARRVTKWNKRVLARKTRKHTNIPSGKSGYKKTGFDPHQQTMT